MISEKTIELASEVLAEFSLFTNYNELAEKFSDYHSGQTSAFYSVSSCLYTQPRILEIFGEIHLLERVLLEIEKTEFQKRDKAFFRKVKKAIEESIKNMGFME